MNWPRFNRANLSASIANNVARAVNTPYTISTTRDALCSYSLNATWAISALVAGSGSAFLEYSTDSGSSWLTASQVSKGLALLTFAGSDEMNLCGYIPAAALVRIRTTVSNMTLAYVRGQEVLQ